MESDDEIFRLTNNCSDLFVECHSVDVLAQDDWIENRLGDFNLWAAGIRASSTGHSSLDYRVRHRLDVKDVIVGLLNGLKESLEKCLLNDSITLPALSDKAHNGNDEAFSNPEGHEEHPWSDFSDDNTEISESEPAHPKGPYSTEVNDIAATIDQLCRISILIRRSGAKFRFRRADLSRKDEDYKDLKSHLQFLILLAQEEIKTEYWTSTDYENLSQRVLDVSQLTIVQNRLVKANIIRRHRICHATRHVALSGAEIPDPDPAAEQRQSEETHIDSQNEPSKTEDEKLDEQQPDGSPKPEIQQETEIADHPPKPMTATDIGTTFLRGPGTVKRRGSTVTKISRVGVKQDYPKCPGRKEMFNCPYCSQTLPSAYAENALRWRGHVAQDLVPYTCVFEDCDTPEVLYGSTEEWMSHLRKTHSRTRWVCDHCLGDGDKNFYETSKQWESHVIETHGGTFPVEQLQDLASMSQRTMLEPMGCPLCYHNDPSEPNAYEHIALHLHGFALRALPWKIKGQKGSDAVSSDIATGDLAEWRAGSTGELDQVGDENLTFGGLDALKQAMEVTISSLTSIRNFKAEGLRPLLNFMYALEKRDFDVNSDDDISAHLHPILRIQESIEQLRQDDKSLTEPLEDIRQSLQEEFDILRELTGLDEPHSTPPILELVRHEVEKPKSIVLNGSSFGDFVQTQDVIPYPDAWAECFKEQEHLATIQSKYLNPTDFDAAKSSIYRISAELEEYGYRKKLDANSTTFFKILKRFAGEAGDPWTFLTLLPYSELQSAICGAILIIVRTVLKADNFRESTIAGLDKITNALASKISLPNLPASKELIGKMSDLCVAIFRLLTSLTREVSEHKSSRFKLIFKKSTVNDEIRILGEVIEERLSKLQSVARTKDTVFVREVQNNFVEILRSNFELGTLHSRLAKDVWDSRLVIEQINTRSEMRVSADTVLSRYRDELEAAEVDQRRILCWARLGREETQKAHFLLSHKKLQTFMQTRSSSMLLALGAARTRPGVYSSAVSLVTAKIVQALRQVSEQQSSAYTIAYFCGFHGRLKDKSSDGKSMIIALILQLLAQHRDFDPSDLKACRTTFRKGTANDLCDLFERLVDSLPTKTRLFCVIDSLDSFMTSPLWREYALGIVERLVDVNSRCMMKILFTTSTHSLGFGHLFEKRDILNLGYAHQWSRDGNTLGNHRLSVTLVGTRLSALKGSEINY